MFNQIKTVMLLGGLFAFFLVLGYLFGGLTGLTIGFIFALVFNLIAFWFSDTLVLKMYGAKEADEKEFHELYSMVRSLSERANISMPGVYLVNSDTPNAFATGRNHKNAVVAVTTGLIRLLSERELRGVIAHEISHIKNKDILISTVVAVVAGAISYLSIIARFSLFFGGEEGENILGVLIMAILAPIIATLVAMAVSRTREYFADSTGAALCKDPNALADALQKLNAGNKIRPFKKANPATSHMFIVNPFSGKSVLNLFSTHPPVVKRIGKLRSMAVNY